MLFRSFNSQAQQFRQKWIISGTTKDSAGTALGNAVLDVFYTEGDRLKDSTISDASGSYSIDVGSNASRFYIVAYKAGSPDVAGTTVNTLVGTLT